jgi:hypothetical protein
MTPKELMVSLIARITLSVLMALVFVPSAHAATQAQIDQARLKGIWWLMVHQNGDGSWKSAPGTEVQVTDNEWKGIRS